MASYCTTHQPLPAQAAHSRRVRTYWGALAENAAGLPLNLTGPVLVSQNAAVGDFHVSAMKPIGNACLTGAAFIAGRFRVAARREAVAT